MLHRVQTILLLLYLWISLLLHHWSWLHEWRIRKDLLTSSGHSEIIHRASSLKCAWATLSVNCCLWLPVRVDIRLLVGDMYLTSLRALLDRCHIVRLIAYWVIEFNYLARRVQSIGAIYGVLQLDGLVETRRWRMNLACQTWILLLLLSLKIELFLRLFPW